MQNQSIDRSLQSDFYLVPVGCIHARGLSNCVYLAAPQQFLLLRAPEETKRNEDEDDERALPPDAAAGGFLEQKGEREENVL
jgi:hypothetical protein